MYLTAEQFKYTFGYNYKDLGIKLEQTKCDDCTLEYKINSLEDLQLVAEAIKNKAYSDGCLDTEIKMHEQAEALRD